MNNKELAELERFQKSKDVTQDDIDDINRIWAGGKSFCELIIEKCPDSADRSAAIRNLRIVVAQAHAAICYKNIK